MFARIAAVLLVTAGITGLLNDWTGGDAGVAFAQVQKAIDRVRSVTFDATTTWPDQREEKVRVLIVGTDRLRMEMDDGDYLVIDRSNGTSLLVKQESKTAVVRTGQLATLPADLYSQIRRLHAKSAKGLPSKQLNGKQAKGFLVDDRDQTMKVWVDPDTDLPLLIESTRVIGDIEVVTTSTNFTFDRKLGAELFSTDAPAGYTVETIGTPEPTEKASAGQLVVTPKVGLGPARFGMAKDDVIGALGEPDAVQPSSSGGELLRYDTRGFWISIGPDGTFTSAACHYHRDDAAPVANAFAGKTKEGIGIGASRNQVASAYGPPNVEQERESRFGKFVTVTYWDLGLTFTLRDDSVEEIDASRIAPAKN